MPNLIDKMYKALFSNYEENENGIWLKCCIPQDKIKENLIAHVMHGEIRIDDGRRISSDQRKKIYVLCHEICDYTGDAIEYMKENILKVGFMIEENRDYFSLSDVDMTTARYFIEYILKFMFEYNIPFNKVHIPLVKEINNYLYLCLVHRKCAVCGDKADIHHVDAVGMGRDRTKIDHTKHRLIALCSKKCHKEAHDIGWLTFKNKHHVDGIKVNQETVKKLGI